MSTAQGVLGLKVPDGSPSPIHGSIPWDILLASPTPGLYERDRNCMCAQGRPFTCDGNLQGQPINTRLGCAA